MLRFKDGDTVFGEYTPIPTNGCGYRLCFEETDYTISAGEQACMSIYFGAAVSPPDGTEILIAGVKFTISHTDNNTPSEVYLPNGSIDNFALLLASTMRDRTEFRDYEITTELIAAGGNYFVKICSKENAYASEFDQTDLATDTTGVSHIIDSYGEAAKYKEEYYVFMRIIDNRTGKPVCEEDFEVPLNVIEEPLIVSGEERQGNIACFELSQIVKQLPQLFITPPRVGDPLYFQDTNQVNYYSIEVYGKYKDGSRDCGRLQTNIIRIGDQQTRSGFPFMRFIHQNYDGLNLNEISDGPLWMTDKPETYKVCKDSPLYFRWHRKTHQHNGTSYKMNFLAEMIYGDGSKEVIDEEIVDLTTAPIQSWEQSEIHVLNLAAIMYNSQYFNQNKTFAKLTFKITYYQSPFSNGDATQEYKLVFDNSPQGHCCGCHVHFLYAGERGNNDTITARCESVITLDVEFNKIGKVEECGEYLGGKVSLTPEEVMLAKTVWIYHEDWEYLVKFISSPKKYVKRDVGTAERFVRVYPTETSFEVYRANKAGRIKFTYVESITRKTY